MDQQPDREPTNLEKASNPRERNASSVPAPGLDQRGEPLPDLPASLLPCHLAGHIPSTILAARAAAAPSGLSGFQGEAAWNHAPDCAIWDNDSNGCTCRTPSETTR